MLDLYAGHSRLPEFLSSVWTWVPVESTGHTPSFIKGINMFRAELFFMSFLLIGGPLIAARGAEKPAPQEIGGKIEWVYNYQEARRISRASGRPMFVVFRCER